MVMQKPYFRAPASYRWRCEKLTFERQLPTDGDAKSSLLSASFLRMTMQKVDLLIFCDIRYVARRLLLPAAAVPWFGIVLLFVVHGTWAQDYAGALLMLYSQQQ
jgi:hypothetical protein